MHPIPGSPSQLNLSQIVREEVVCWTAGLGFTLALFFALARVETVGTQPHTEELMDMRIVSLPPEQPPPDTRPSEPVPASDDVPPLTGIEVGSSDSSIKISVAPPEVETLLTETHVPPRAVMSVGRIGVDFKPRADMQVDVNRVYQQSEIDQIPRAVVRVTPPVQNALFGKRSELSVRLWILIDTTGHAESARVFKPSGVPAFDDIVARTVKDEWLFTVAIKQGKKVRCLVEQKVRIVIGGGSPFDVL